jgi:hypothetical protein
MPLKSQLFKGDPKLEACLVSDPAHIVLGARGEHVGKIQKALVTLGAGVISADEIVSMTYGPTTARTVFAFKGPPRNIINRAYQRTPDNIVGKMTIEALDREFFDFENRPPLPPASIFVSLTPDGFPHDHSTCPFETRAQISRVHHLGTPINPQGFGRKINLGGEGETKYLGFEDFIPNVFPGPIRPLTSSLRDHCASDICLRFSPILKDASEEKGKKEIFRIAQPRCRLTFCGDVARFGATLFSLGTRIERVVMPNPIIGGTSEAWVIVMR